MTKIELSAAPERLGCGRGCRKKVRFKHGFCHPCLFNKRMMICVCICVKHVVSGYYARGMSLEDSTRWGLVGEDNGEMAGKHMLLGNILKFLRFWRIGNLKTRPRGPNSDWLLALVDCENPSRFFLMLLLSLSFLFLTWLFRYAADNVHLVKCVQASVR